MKSHTCFDNSTIFNKLFICICSNSISSSPNLFGNMSYSKKLNCIFHHKNIIFLVSLTVQSNTLCACQLHRLLRAKSRNPEFLLWARLKNTEKVFFSSKKTIHLVMYSVTLKFIRIYFVHYTERLIKYIFDPIYIYVMDIYM